MAMTVTKTRFKYRIDRWDARGDTIIDHIGGHDDVQVATAAYNAACNRWPGDPITLRQGTIVIEGSRPDPMNPLEGQNFLVNPISDPMCKDSGWASWLAASSGCPQPRRGPSVDQARRARL